MTVAAQTIIKRVAYLLHDPSSVRWTVGELVSYLNAAQNEMAVYRPDAFATTATLALTAGAKQSLPSGATKLIGVVRNTSGAKRAVRPVKKALLDAQNPEWYSSAGSDEVVHYMYDERDPKTFYVYPPATSSSSVEITYAGLPTLLTEPGSGTFADVTGNITVSDHFANALGDYVMYRAFSKDADFANDASRAAAYYTAFANAVGIEVKATTTVAPAGATTTGA